MIIDKWFAQAVVAVQDGQQSSFGDMALQLNVFGLLSRIWRQICIQIMLGKDWHLRWQRPICFGF